MSHNADETYAWKILGVQLRLERKQLEQNDVEYDRLQKKRGETLARIEYLESAIIKLAGEVALEMAKST